MKFIYIALFLVYNCQFKVPKLVNLDKGIDEVILKEVFKEIESFYNLEQSVIILNINKIKDKYEVRASAIYKDDFNFVSYNKKNKIFGLAYYNEIPVLVFGDSVEKFYKLEKDTEIIDFIKSKKKRRENKGLIPEGPINFEPMVWVYSFYDTTGFSLIEMEAGLVLF